MPWFISGDFQCPWTQCHQLFCSVRFHSSRECSKIDILNFPVKISKKNISARLECNLLLTLRRVITSVMIFEELRVLWMFIFWENWERNDSHISHLNGESSWTGSWPWTLRAEKITGCPFSQIRSALCHVIRHKLAESHSWRIPCLMVLNLM